MIGGVEYRTAAKARVDLVQGAPLFSDTPQPTGTKTGDQVQNIGFATVARTVGQVAGDFTLTLVGPVPESQRAYKVTPLGTSSFMYNAVKDASTDQKTVRVQFRDAGGVLADPESFDIDVEMYPAH